MKRFVGMLLFVALVLAAGAEIEHRDLVTKNRAAAEQLVILRERLNRLDAEIAVGADR